ncbi:hypothetical protein ATER59S_02355 [Aquamicrobium terrae]
MPHSDRVERLDYLHRWKLKNRPSPAPVSQGDPTLPPLGIMAFSMDGSKVQCHVCGRWYGTLNTHLKTHDLDAISYKELFDLPRTASLLPPVTKAKQRQAALDRDQGAFGRMHIPPPSGRPAGQASRLGVRIAASEARKGVYTRGGEKTTKDTENHPRT